MPSQELTEQFAPLSDRSGEDAYQAGVLAWYANQPDRVCPYDRGSVSNINGLRIVWMSGYYDASIYRVMMKPLGERKDRKR